MKKVRVLVKADTMNMGGLENQLMHLLRKSDKNQFQIDFACGDPNAYYRDEIEALGGKFYAIPRMSWRWSFPYCKTLYQIMKDGNYDVVHSNELFHSGIVMKIAKAAGIKVRIAHSHSFSDSDGINNKRSFFRTMYNALMRHWILKYSTEQIACASTAGEFLFGKKCMQKDSFHLVYNSIDTTKYLERYDQLERGEFCDDGWINVLHVGRVYPVKRQLFDVDIAEKFKEKGKRIRILCAGNAFDEAYMHQIQNEIKKRNLQEYIMMLGSRSDVDTLFRKASVAILPSVYEGMPLALIEAQAAGLQCVVADTFSREVDFDIDLVTWMNPESTAEKWAEEIERKSQLEKADKDQVVVAIQKKGFDSRIFASKICELYIDSIQK